MPRERPRTAREGGLNEPREEPSLGEMQMQQQVEQAVEERPYRGREHAGEEPAFLALHLEIDEYQHGHGDRKADEHDQRKEADHPGRRECGAAPNDVALQALGELEVRCGGCVRLAENRPERFGGGETEERDADDQWKE